MITGAKLTIKGLVLSPVTIILKSAKRSEAPPSRITIKELMIVGYFWSDVHLVASSHEFRDMYNLRVPQRDTVGAFMVTVVKFNDFEKMSTPHKIKLT
jgi:hypothetical protein